ISGFIKTVEPQHAERRTMRALWDDQICASAERGGFSGCDFDELLPDNLVGRLADKKLVGVVGLGPLPIAVDSSIQIAVQRKFADPLRSLFRMLLGERGLIDVIAFESSAEKYLAFAIHDLAQGIHLVVSPRLERHPDQ